MNMMLPATPALDALAMDRLMPMHVVVSATGHIRQAGPTLQKLVPEGLLGQRLLEVFEPRRPRKPTSVADLAGAPGGRITLVLRGNRTTQLKGLAVALPEGGLFINLSFGISLLDAIHHHALTAADFAPTDLSIEMLYLVEAKAAVMTESQKLNERLKDAKHEAEAQALSDTLTGLGNRRAMDESLTRFLARGESFGLMHLDLDYFKDVNDTLGHAAGDHVLSVVADVLRAVTRSQDVVARVGGDEFVVLIRGVTEAETLVELGQRLIAGLEQPIEWQRRSCRISGSVGITTTAHYPHPDADRMLSDADEALYVSKRGGRATVTMVQTAAEMAEGSRRKKS